MEPLGFSRLPSRERRVAGFDAPYANSENAKLPCFGSSESPATDALGRPLARWLFFPLHAADIQRLSSFTYLSAIRAACVHTDVVFGRAFHATFVDMVSPEELHGAIDMLTWVQYFGPGLSSIIGVQRLRTAAWYALECLPTGAHL